MDFDCLVSKDHLASELRIILGEHLAILSGRLDQLSHGQAALTSLMQNIHGRSVLAELNPQPDRNPDCIKVEEVEGMHMAMVPPEASFRNPGSTKEDKGDEVCVEFCDILPSSVNPEPNHTKDIAGPQEDFESVDKSRREQTTKFASQVGLLNRKRNLTSSIEQDGVEEFKMLYHRYKHETEKAEEVASLRRERSWFSGLQLTNRILVLDQFMTIIVVMNALFLGISADYWKYEINAWFIVDIMFFVFFFTELLVKFRMLGIRELYCGSQRFSNIFDLLLVISDAIQLILVNFMRDSFDAMRDEGVPSFSVFRIARVLRVARLLRVMRHSAFEDVLAMMEAVFGGVQTLTWAIVLYLVVIYVIALLCRDGLGSYPEYKYIYPYFSNVPRSLFTVYRCSFGDCSTDDGRPIIEAVHKSWGALYSILFCLLQFVIVIGIFNVISAIFLDRTIAHAAKLEEKRIKDQLMDKKLWASGVSVFVLRCLESLGKEDELDKLGANSIDEIVIPSDVVASVCQADPQAIRALIELGIDEYDHRNLAHILDTDLSGNIHLHQVITGLQHMRGLPRRSDDVMTYLMLQRLQQKVEDVRSVIFHQEKKKSTRILRSAWY